MHSMFAILFCFAIVVGINGAWLKQPASINKDAVELTQLLEKLWSLKPDILNRLKPFVYCEIMDKCCEDKDRVEAISIMSQYIINTDDGRFEQIMQTCMNSSTSNMPDHVCSSIVKSIVSIETVYRDSNVRKYLDIIDRHGIGLSGIIDQIQLTCNSEEFHAFACLSNKKLMEKCANKVLQKIYNLDYKNYQKIIENAKQLMTEVNQQISTALTKDTNKE